MRALAVTQTLHELYFWRFPRCDGHRRPVLAPPIWITSMNQLAPDQRIKVTRIVGSAIRAGYRTLGDLCEAAQSGTLAQVTGISARGVAFAAVAFRREEKQQPDASEAGAFARERAAAAVEATPLPGSAVAPNR